MSPEPSAPARFEPPVGPASMRFWEATRSQSLELPWCKPCARPVWFPREVCPRCLSGSIEWRPASGSATVYAFTVEHRPLLQGVFGDRPYVVALVDLDEGVRMMTNIVGCEPGGVRVGMPVQLCWEPLSDGRNLPLFCPA